MLKAEKKEYLKDFTQAIRDKELILVDYEGMSVKQMSEVRLELKKSGSAMTVIKNTLLQRSLKDRGVDLDDSNFKGMSALVTVGESFSDAGKVVLRLKKRRVVKN